MFYGEVMFDRRQHEVKNGHHWSVVGINLQLYGATSSKTLTQTIPLADK